MNKLNEEDLVYRLRKRAEIRRQITTRKSVQEGKPDRISDLLEEAANEIVRLKTLMNVQYGSTQDKVTLSEKDHALTMLQRVGIDLLWAEVPEDQWEQIIATVKDMEPHCDDCPGSLHCYDETYTIDGITYNLTYEDTNGDRPISIKMKKA